MARRRIQLYVDEETYESWRRLTPAQRRLVKALLAEIVRRLDGGGLFSIVVARQVVVRGRPGRAEAVAELARLLAELDRVRTRDELRRLLEEAVRRLGGGGRR